MSFLVLAASLFACLIFWLHIIGNWVMSIPADTLTIFLYVMQGIVLGWIVYAEESTQHQNSKWFASFIAVLFGVCYPLTFILFLNAGLMTEEKSPVEETE